MSGDGFVLSGDEGGIRAHLLAQSRNLPMPPLQRRLLEVVVGMVDDNGRLHINPDDFADLSPGTPERARLDSAVAALQSLDPPASARATCGNASCCNWTAPRPRTASRRN